MSSDAAIYQETLQGFREAVQSRTVKVQLLTQRANQRNDQIEIIRSVVEPEVVVVIGTPALDAVTGQVTHVPIVHTMAFNPDLGRITEAKNITGVSMIPGPDKTISLIKELDSKIRRVGVMHDPNWNSSLFWKAQSAAQKQNIHLVEAKINSAGDIAAALKHFEDKIDLLWLWPDERFLGDDILQRVFLYSFEKKIPVLGLSERHTQMGALLSFSYGSAKDMGKQAGQLVLNILGNAGHSLPGAVSPRQSKLTLNLKTARKLPMEVPDSIVQRADNGIKAPIYRDGDWWIFRTKGPNSMGDTQIEEHLVTYKNGRFQTEYPQFLNGGDFPNHITFLPFASLYFEDPQRRWLDFPLLPGKSWSFRYRYYNAHGNNLYRGGMSNANAEVVGDAPEPIQTPAGKFKATQIDRVDTLSGVGYLTYFYSADTKSIVKLTATKNTWVASSIGSKSEYQLELVAYGHGSKK